jgi:hypothetical protein
MFCVPVITAKTVSRIISAETMMILMIMMMMIVTASQTNVTDTKTAAWSYKVVLFIHTEL